MKSLIDIANKAVVDYGFRQIVQWSPEDIAAQWDLSAREAEVLHGPLREALDALPVPVEPAEVPTQQERLAGLIGDALRSDS